MKPRLIATLWLAALIMALGAPSVGSAQTPPWEIEKLPSRPAPAFSLPDLAGKPVSLADFKGQLLLINFWATWCGPCREEMPALDGLYRKFKGQGLTLIGIAIDSDPNLVKQFLTTTKTKFPTLSDPEMTCHDAYKVFTYPTTFLVDRKGIVQKYWLGTQEWDSEEFEQILREYLH